MLKTLRVENYKSLQNQEIDLKPLTVFVGPNAVGKSNILDCLMFIARLASSGSLSEPVTERGEYRDLVWGGENEQTISLSLLLEQATAKEGNFEYSIRFGNPPRPGIVEERGTVIDRQQKIDAFHRKGDELKHGTSTVKGLGSIESALSQISEISWLPKMMRSWCFYDFQPASMREKQRVAKETRLVADGSNVATLLHWIYSEQPEIFARVEELLKTAVPEVDRLISPLTEDGRCYIAWREKGIPGRIPMWNMSEGSVRLVALLLALTVPEPPPLVTFEIPEVHLHPYLMEYLADILKMGARQSQILVTTHSPFLLNYLDFDNLLIVKKENGATKVEPVEDSQHLREALRELGLGELWYSGHIGGVP